MPIVWNVPQRKHFHVNFMNYMCFITFITVHQKRTGEYCYLNVHSLINLPQADSSTKK